MKIYFCFFIVMIFSLPLLAQNKYTISGYIKDSSNGENLIGAAITVQGQSKGITSNAYGFYSITLNQGKYVLVCSFVGYKYKAIEVDLTADTKFNFEILNKTDLSQEVVVSSKKRDGNVKSR